MMFRYADQTAWPTRFLVGVCVTMVTLPGLYGCRNQSDSEVEGKIPASSSTALPQGTSPSASVPALKLPTQSNPQSNVAGAQPHSKKGKYGLSPSPQGKTSGKKPLTSLLAPGTVKIPPGLANQDAPIPAPTAVPVPTGVPPQPSNTVSVPSSAPIDAPPLNTPQAAKPSLPAANIPIDQSSTGTIPSNPSNGASSPVADPTDGLTEEAKTIQRLNQPLDSNLRLNPPSSSAASQATSSTVDAAPLPGVSRRNNSSFSSRTSAPSTPGGANTSGFSSNANSSSSSSSSSSANSSGLRSLEYRYNPSTGTYSTGGAE